MFRRPPHEHGAQYPQTLIRAKRGVGDPLGMRHDAHDVAALAADAGNIIGRAVRVPEVAQHDTSFVFQLFERVGVCEVVPLVVGDGQGQLLARVTARRPRRVRGLDPDPYAVADKTHVRVTEQGTGQQVRLGKNLKAVADAEYGPPILHELFERGHDLREAGDSTRPQVVAVGESSRYDHGVNTLEVSVGVPQFDRLRTHPLHTVQSVAVAVGAGKDRNAYSHIAPLRFAPPHSLIRRPPTHTLLSSGWRGGVDTWRRRLLRSRPPA